MAFRKKTESDNLADSNKVLQENTEQLENDNKVVESKVSDNDEFSELGDLDFSNEGMLSSLSAELNKDLYFLLVSNPLDARKVTIRPYIDKGAFRMGLEQYDMVLFDGCKQKEVITCYNYHGVYRYKTGLDEFAPEIMTIQDLDERKRRILQIRKEVAALERVLGNPEQLKPSDPNFWSKVKFLNPTNSEFWEDIYILLDNNPYTLDLSKIKDYLIYKAILAKGFSIIAPSYDEVLRSSSLYMYYLDEGGSKSGVIKNIRKKSKVLSTLEKLYTERKSKVLFYLFKILVSPRDTQVSINEHIDTLYERIAIWVESVKDDRLFDEFMRLSQTDENWLRVRAMLQQLVTYDKVYVSEGIYRLFDNDIKLGVTLDDSATILNKSEMKEQKMRAENFLKTIW